MEDAIETEINGLRRELTLMWEAHSRDHAADREAIRTALTAVDKLAELHAVAHQREHAAHTREHALHEQFHETEHKMTETALNKADSSLNQRLEVMNEFRAQLETQAASFLTRETFDAYSKEQVDKAELALKNITEKYDAIMNAIVTRHDSDIDTMKGSIQTEREYRKAFEGSMNTWKWLASFLGASGVAGVILLFITRFTS